MKYELKKWQDNSGITDNGDKTASKWIIITVGIVGDKYGFVSPNISVDVVKVTWSKDETQNAIDAMCQKEALKYVEDKYKNS